MNGDVKQQARSRRSPTYSYMDPTKASMAKDTTVAPAQPTSQTVRLAASSPLLPSILIACLVSAWLIGAQPRRVVHGVSERLLRRPSLKNMAEQLYRAAAEPAETFRQSSGSPATDSSNARRRPTYVTTKETRNGEILMEVSGIIPTSV